MSKKLVRCLVLLWWVAAASQSAAEVERRVSLDALSNYVYRGLSHSDHGTALLAGIDIQHLQSGWFGGVRIGSVDYARPGDRRHRETIAFGGRHQRLNDNFAYTLALNYTDYDRDTRIDYDWWEVRAAVEWRDHWSAAYHYSPRWYGFDNDSHIVELAHIFALTPRLHTRVLGGYATIGGSVINEYFYANGELSIRVAQVDVRAGYSTTSSGADRLGGMQRSQWSMGIGWSTRW